MIMTIADPWLAQNAGRRYPLADDAETDVPDNAILDFRCSVHAAAMADAPYAMLGRIANQGTVRKVSFDLYWNGAKQDTLVFSIPSNLATTGHYTAVAYTDRATGMLTVTAAILSVDSGYKDVPVAMTTVVSDCLGVDSVQGLPGVSYDTEDRHRIDNPQAVLTGDVVLDTGANTDPYLDGNRLRLEIAKGYGRGEWCQRQAAVQNCENVLFTINGERPGSDGDIRLVGEGGVLVTPKPGEHVLEITIDRPASDLMTKDCTAAC